MKICSRCHIKKSLNDFYADKKSYLGVRSECKICTRSYRKLNRNKIRDIDKFYYLTHKEKICAYSRNYRKTHKKEREIYDKRYQASNKDKRRCRDNKKYKTNAKLRLNISLSVLIRRSLKGNKNGAHWEDSVGYTLDILRKHLEKQFVNGMSWENYGEWHVDHIIPISVFNFTEFGHTDFKKCWALKNLQPMWSKDNIVKNNNLETHFQPSLLL